MRRFSGFRLAAVGSALACVLALVPVVPASAHSASDSHPNNNYLALGDSVTFGYNPLLLMPPAVPPLDPSAFVGYPQLAATLFHPNLNVVNLSCPGETSTSLITQADDNGCQSYRTYIGPLHVTYPGSQFSYAKSYIASNPGTKFVSLMIGGNDLLLLQDGCKAQTQVNVNVCIIGGLPSLLVTLRTNIRTIYAGLRAQGYHGDFVAVTYYSTNYRDPIVTGAIAAVDVVLAGVTKAFGGKVADGFGTFAKAAAPYGGDTCTAGLLIPLPPTTTCDIHPSRKGANLLASALYAAERPPALFAAERR
jgi:lysophospholipase L1-like esterase